ncbi:MAG: hypothetical protein R2749_03970 [Acidimicrobiales bacterium]
MSSRAIARRRASPLPTLSTSRTTVSGRRSAHDSAMSAVSSVEASSTTTTRLGR